MAFTSDKIWETCERGQATFVVKNNETIYAGALVGIDSSGYLVNWDNTWGNRFVGIALETKTGDTSSSPAVEIKVDTSGVILKNISNANISASQSNVGDFIFSTGYDIESDGTLSATSNVGPVGKIVAYNSDNNTIDVMLLTPAESRMSIARLSDNTGGTASDTISDVGGSFNQSTLNNNFASLAGKINEILQGIT